MPKVSPDPAPRRFDAYIRVSKLKGREGPSFISPDQQREQIEGWAKLRGVEIVAWHEDIDQSGGKINRPGLEAMLARLRDGETQGVAVAKLDRLSRLGVADAVKLVEQIHGYGGQIAAIDLGIDPTTTFGEFAMTVMLALSRMERRRITDNWKDSRGRAAERGVHMGPTPFGYVRHGDRDARGHLLPGQNPPVEIDPVAGPVVTEIFERRASGEGWAPIWRSLSDRGVVGSDGRQFARTQLKRIVRNDVYLGIVRDGVSGTKTEDAHPTLVGYETFQRAQGVRGVRGASKDSEALLAGLCRCASCRYSMFAHRDTHADGNNFLRYICARHNHNGDCPDPAMVLVRETGRKQYLDRVAAKKAARMVDEEGADRRAVAREFGIALRTLDIWRQRQRDGELDEPAHRGLDDYVVEKVFERLPEILMRGYDDNAELERLGAEAKSAIARLNDYGIDRELEDALGRDAYLARGRVLRDAAEEAERAYGEELHRSSTRVSQAARRMRDDWDTLTVAEKRQILASVVHHVFVKPPVRRHSQEPISPARVHVVFFDDAEVDIPRQGRRDYVMRPFEFAGADADPGNVGVASL